MAAAKGVQGTSTISCPVMTTPMVPADGGPVWRLTTLTGTEISEISLGLTDSNP